MNIKLLASDLDGTLLLNGAERPTDEAIELIRELKARGVMFAAASGRQYHSLREMFRPVADEIAYVCENGCLTIYQNEILHQANFSKQTAYEIYTAVQKYPSYQAVMSGAYHTYVSKEDSNLANLLRDYFKYDVKIFDDFFSIPEEIIKLPVFCERGVTPEDVTLLQEQIGDIGTVVTSGTVWMDIMPNHITKQIGLEKLADYLEIPIADCMAVGDEYNDYEMLQTVGHPVAMENAREDILKICPTHTSTVESLMKSLL